MKYSLWNPTEQAPRNVVECQEVVAFKCNAMMIEGYSTHEVSVICSRNCLPGCSKIDHRGVVEM